MGDTAVGGSVLTSLQRYRIFMSFSLGLSVFLLIRIVCDEEHAEKSNIP